MKYKEFYENKKHGTEDFPLQYYYVDKDYPEYVMPLHWHNEFEIIHIISGKFTLFVQNTEYHINQGEIAFINCGFLHRGIPENCKYEVAVFDINMLCRNKGDAVSPYFYPIMSGEKTIKTLIHPIEDQKLSSSITAFFNLIHYKSEYYEISSLGLLYNIFCELYLYDKIENKPQSKKSKSKFDEIEGLLKWIENHYNEKITLGDLAAECGLNKKYLCRIFKEFTGNTPIVYLNKIRIESACREMAVHKKTVTEAAVECGFNDSAYFTRVFKKIKGITPKAYIAKTK